MESFKRGALIVIEGVDRSGKTSQAKQLVESLRKLNVKAEGISFPDRSTDSGKVIAEYLKQPQHKLHDNAIHLLFTANRWEKFDLMRDMLLSGKTIVVDRYSYSGVAYSAAKMPENCNLDWFKSPESGLIKPDRVFLLTLSDEAMSNRPGFGTERYENVEMQRKVKNVYKQFKDKTWRTVDAAESFEKVHSNMLADIVARIKDVQNQQLEYFDFISQVNKENTYIPTF